MSRPDNASGTAADVGWRPSRRQSLPAADVAALCLQMHRELLGVRSSLEVPEVLDRMMAALCQTGGLEAVAVILQDHSRPSVIGGWQIPHDADIGEAGDTCPPSRVTGLDGQSLVLQARVATRLDRRSKIHLAAYARSVAGKIRARLWLDVVLPLVALAVRQAQQTLNMTQSSIVLEAEVERRTREVQRLSASERLLLAQLREQTAQLQAANVELRQLDEIKTGIISSVSHELRTPISTIKTLTRLLGRPDLPAHKLSHYLDVINAECDRQMTLVNDLLDLARLEAGAGQPKRTWHDLDAIVETVAKRLRAPIEAAGQRLILQLPKKCKPEVWGHPKELEQIIGNLMSNAHKFTNPGGIITVTVSQEPATVVFSVADTGIGIAPGLTERIFDIFYRIPHPDRPSSGTGVGLAIVRRLVDNLGGTVTVESQEGVGSRFIVTWPRRSSRG